MADTDELQLTFPGQNTTVATTRQTDLLSGYTAHPGVVHTSTGIDTTFAPTRWFHNSES